MLIPRTRSLRRGGPGSDRQAPIGQCIIILRIQSGAREMPSKIRSMAFGACALVSLLVVLATVSGCPQEAPDPIPSGSGGVHWLRIAQISDTQIVDEESPNRSIRFAAVNEGAWRPQEAYGLQTLDATLGVINDRHNGKAAAAYPIDFVIATGDLTDSSQRNELRWFIDTMDGQWIVPDSGELDGERRDQAPEDNPKLGFQAVGLDPEIPWYTVYGNHDCLSIGVFNVDRTASNPERWTAPLLRPVAALVGLHLLDPLLNALQPTSRYSPAIIRGSEEQTDPDTLELLLGRVKAGRIAQDPSRHFTNRTTFVEEHFDTATLPVGHGFSEENITSGLTRYAVEPKEGIPVRLVVLDTVAPDPPYGLPAHYGVMTREQFENFLKPEIEDARAKDEFVLLASHHPSEDFDLPYPQPQVRTKEWRDYIASQPNIIAHVCGHSHKNFVTRVNGAYSYFEIQTGSIIDYPQEGRILDVYYDEASETIRLESTMFSHMENPTRLSEESYRRSIVHGEQFKLRNGESDMDAVMKAIARENGMAPVDAFPALPSMEESYGEDAYREFAVTFSRGRASR